jgi:beta-galactosidase GanA
MGLLNPSKGVVDFDEWRALQPFYEMARKAGLWVVLRPGMRVLASFPDFLLTRLTGPVRRRSLLLTAPGPEFTASPVHQRRNISWWHRPLGHVRSRRYVANQRQRLEGSVEAVCTGHH